jgi:hypothetical protein
VTPRASGVGASGVVTQLYALPFSFALVTKTLGSYYTVNGNTQVLAGRPVEPQYNQDVALTGNAKTVAQGALLVGGRTHDTPINPYISAVVTEALYLTEPPFDTVGFYPERIVAVNRLTKLDGSVTQNLVVVPGQFKSITGSVPTTGTQRLWDAVDVVVYYAPFTNTDHIQPTIYQVGALPSVGGVAFTAIVSDNVGVGRVVVLYRQQNATQWSSFDLTRVGASQLWQGTRNDLSGVIEYIVQSVDVWGNVAQITDYGNPFVLSSGQKVYLPLVVR